MISTILLLVLWTWGLTPLWVNVTCTTLIAIRWFIKFIAFCVEHYDDKEKE